MNSNVFEVGNDGAELFNAASSTTAGAINLMISCLLPYTPAPAFLSIYIYMYVLIGVPGGWSRLSPAHGNGQRNAIFRHQLIYDVRCNRIIVDFMEVQPADVASAMEAKSAMGEGTMQRRVN